MPAAFSIARSIILPVATAAAGLFAMAYIGYLLQAARLPLLTVSEYKLVNFTFSMQLYVLPLSFAGLLFLFLYHRAAFRHFFSFRLNTERGDDSGWRTIGPAVLLAFAAGTSFFMSFRVISDQGEVNGTFFRLLPLVVLFSATNAWTEEILSRFVIVGGLYGKLSPVSICWISAVIFGIPHFLSGGVLSVMVSGLLGWLLAKSVIETNSLGWALLIHFLLDVVIFGAGAMVVAGAQ